MVTHYSTASILNKRKTYDERLTEKWGSINRIPVIRDLGAVHLFFN
jgi:hypothetical protein